MEADSAVPPSWVTPMSISVRVLAVASEITRTPSGRVWGVSLPSASIQASMMRGATRTPLLATVASTWRDWRVVPATPCPNIVV